MAAWIKMPLGMELGLNSGDCVRWRPRSTSTKKAAEPPPQFSAHFYCGQTAACIKMPLGMEVRLSPGDFGLDGDPAPLPKGRRRPGRESPNFRPMFIIVIVISLEHCTMHIVVIGVFKFKFKF